MIEIALYQPEIPPNTGNIIRLSANLGCRLHLIHPLGFNLTAKQVTRAGLDYHDLSNLTEHKNWEAFLSATQKPLIACSTKGTTCYSDWEFDHEILLFGPETRGLPPAVLSHERVAQVIKIPMVAKARSLNLANSVAVIAYEAWRQHNFLGA